MIKSTNSIYCSPILLDVPHIFHGFSTKLFGDMRDVGQRNHFITACEGDPKAALWMNQEHGNVIHQVIKADMGHDIKQCDGMVYAYDKTFSKQPILTVHAADCTPILAVDPVRNIIGVAHAGWKGTLKHIAGSLIDHMVKLGANASDVRVVLGPHIGPYCYESDEGRADEFNREFGKHTGCVIHREHKWFVDIGEGSCQDLLKAGVTQNHIDFDEKICTACQKEDFFSYRENGGKNTGEILGIIGFTK